MDAAASRILEHLAGSGNGNDKLMLPAQEERRLERALALLGPEQTGEYSAALKKAINTLEEVTQNVLDTTNLMVKGLKELISNNAPAWTESGPKSRSEATRNLCLSLQILQGYGRGLMGAPDRTEEHTHHLRVDNLEGDKTPREALCEIEQILTGRTINFLPPANDGGSDTPQGASQE